MFEPAWVADQGSYNVVHTVVTMVRYIRNIGSLPRVWQRCGFYFDLEEGSKDVDLRMHRVCQIIETTDESVGRGLDGAVMATLMARTTWLDWGRCLFCPEHVRQTCLSRFFASGIFAEH